MNSRLLILPLILLFFACRKDEPDVIYPAYFYNENVDQIPDGGTGYLQDVDLSGKGNLTNRANTTLIIDGNVKVDALSVIGKVILTEGSTLTLNNQLQVSGGAEMVVLGEIKTETLTQIGDLFLDEGEMLVKGKYTISGGTTLYMQNAYVEVDEMVIIGEIQAVENEYTKGTNVYSVIHSIESKYLNRAGGSVVCGPVLFTTDNDQGASGQNMEDVTTEAINDKTNLRDIYSLSADDSLYKYQDVCSPLINFPKY